MRIMQSPNTQFLACNTRPFVYFITIEFWSCQRKRKFYWEGQLCIQLHAQQPLSHRQHQLNNHVDPFLSRSGDKLTAKIKSCIFLNEISHRWYSKQPVISMCVFNYPQLRKPTEVAKNVERGTCLSGCVKDIADQLTVNFR